MQPTKDSQVGADSFKAEILRGSSNSLKATLLKGGRAAVLQTERQLLARTLTKLRHVRGPSLQLSLAAALYC